MIATVLGAALMHAAWNTIAKLEHRSGDAVIVGIAAALPALAALPWVGIPSRSAWPQLAASIVIHVAYFRVLAQIYRGGALSVSYPLMRGLPPLAVAAGSVAFFGETLNIAVWTAIAVLVAGVVLLGWDGLSRGAVSSRVIAFVALQVMLIAAYTLIDASGVRVAGNAFAYVAWLFVLTAVASLVPARREVRRVSRGDARTLLVVLIGGALTFASYTVVLWAMLRAPVALVAALRETSTLFAASFGALLLDERFGARRWVALALIFGGVAGMRLG
jgi:drug/metabolite transporter (DMT)-like permease